MADEKIVRKHVIAYFALAFQEPASRFKRTTKVRLAYKNDAAWAALADTFNAMAWMRQLRVLLSQQEMGATSTIGEITDLIMRKAKADRLAALSGAEFGRKKKVDGKKVFP